MTADLVAFLNARLAEDKEAADGIHAYHCANTVDDTLCSCDVPVRLLADVQAKRAILAMHTGHHECVAWRRHSTVLAPDPDAWGRDTATVLVTPGYIHENDPTLRLLALPYADHQDYQPEWKP